jgi:hypothetical protein
MSKRAALVCALALAGHPAVGEEKKPVRVYTNADLERLRPLRGETGVLSRPGTAPEPRERRRETADGERQSRSEAYWRKEAARVRARVRALRDQADGVREQIERRAVASLAGKGGRARGRAAWTAEDARARRLEDLLAQIRELESDLDDRARREGIPPGWLR